MRTPAALVRAFHRRFDLVVRDRPQLIQRAEVDRRVHLLLEEVAEYVAAQYGLARESAEALARAWVYELGSYTIHGAVSGGMPAAPPSLPAIAHEFADVLGVLLGDPLHYGFDADRIFAAVHREHMRRTPALGGGKPDKPADYAPEAHAADELHAQAFEPAESRPSYVMIDVHGQTEETLRAIWLGWQRIVTAEAPPTLEDVARVALILGTQSMREDVVAALFGSRTCPAEDCEHDAEPDPLAVCFICPTHGPTRLTPPPLEAELGYLAALSKEPPC